VRLVIHSIKNNRGQSLVEFALIAPLLILLLMGIMECGRIFNQTLVVTAAAREGARSAAVGGSDVTVLGTVNQAVASIGTTNLTVVVTPSARVSGQNVTVTVTKPITIVTPVISQFFKSATYNATGTAVMRVE